PAERRHQEEHARDPVAVQPLPLIIQGRQERRILHYGATDPGVYRFADRGPLNVARGGLASRIDHDPNLVVATPKLREFGERHGVGRYPASRWLGRHGGPGEVLVLLRIEPPGSDEIVGTSLQRLRGCRELTCLEQDRLGQAAIEVDAADRSRRLDLCLARIGWRHGWWRTRRRRHRIGKHGGPEIEILLTVAGHGPQALVHTRGAGRV